MTTILIVDDEPLNSTSLARHLRRREPDWQVLEANTEVEAEQIIASGPIDVVVTDLVMTTNHGGIQVLHTAKRADPFTMVIVITAFELLLDRYSAFELGAFDCVPKNAPGVVAAEEILVKTRAAVKFRQLTMDQIASEKRLAYLGRYFDPTVFQAIDDDPRLLDIRTRTVTICFWDIRGFSLLSEVLKAHPQFIADFLKEYFDIAAQTIHKHGGILDKFIGDGVMALFGVLDAEPDQDKAAAISAIHAALELRRLFDGLLGRWMQEWSLHVSQQINIGLGCGINTGDALVGNVGTQNREQFTALGPSVNFAQRLEARADKGEILISGTCHTRIRDSFQTESAGQIDNIKNIPGIFLLHRVLAR